MGVFRKTEPVYGINKRTLTLVEGIREPSQRGGRRNSTLTRSKVCVRQRVPLLWVRGWDFDSFRSARGHMGDVE